MTKKEKLLSKARNNPGDLSFKEFQTMMQQAGWVLDHQTGSHLIWYSLNRVRLPIQNRKGKAKGYQIKQFLLQYDRENGDE